MDKPPLNAEDVFARALELPTDVSRQNFVAEACAGKPDLRREVESLLRAHDKAGEFLVQPAAPPVSLSTRAVPPSSTTRQTVFPLNAAVLAEAFLREAPSADEPGLRSYLAGLPEAVRGEVRERVEAGRFIRRLRADARTATDLTETRETPDAPPQLPGFRLEQKLGWGGLGVVYAAHDEKLDRRVAIKILRRRGDEGIRRRLLDEARKAAALGDPAVVTIFSVLDEVDPPAIVMERIDGFPLDRFAAQLNFEQKARLLREVVRGLAVAHQRGLVHRDLKPDNILVGPDLRPRILDFGLALTLEEAGRQGRGFEGTPLYASPEQVRGQPLTSASDVFSFGSLMFKVLTGRPPFAGEGISQVLEAVATTSPPFLREVAVGVPEDLQAICLACLAWNPADRPTAAELVVELGRFLVGEPVRLRPKLYEDLLRRSISEYANQAQAWESQSIISREEHDAMASMHRRLLADEDHWLIDARRITLLQTILSASTWLAVVASVLVVWMLRDDLGPPWRWALPAGITLTLLGAGHLARRDREPLPAATFLAGAALAIVPSTLALLAELGWFSVAPEGVDQLFAGTFTNQQIFAASLTGWIVSAFGLWRLKMTGFAWTTAVLGSASYVSCLMLFNWLGREPEIRALWCLPLIVMEPVALALERKGRVRWTLPFHLVALVAFVVCLDVLAEHGPTLHLLGVTTERWPYFDSERMETFSFALNGLLFLGLMLASEGAASLDLRRASRILEILALLHLLGPLFANAMNHQGDPHVPADVTLYLGVTALLLVLAPFRSRWRLLVGGLLGCGLGSYLLVALDLVPRKPFIVGLGLAGLLVAMGTHLYIRRQSRGGRLPGQHGEHPASGPDERSQRKPQ